MRNLDISQPGSQSAHRLLSTRAQVAFLHTGISRMG